jgi:hypothetical protein
VRAATGGGGDHEHEKDVFCLSHVEGMANAMPGDFCGKNGVLCARTFSISEFLHNR